MKDRPLFDKVSLGIAIVSAIFAGLSFFSQIGLLGGKSTDSQAGIEELADTIVAENSMTSEAVTCLFYTTDAADEPTGGGVGGAVSV